MSKFNIIILSSEEKVLAWLDSEKAEITESNEWNKIRRINIEYPVSDLEHDYTKLFQIGNKIYIPDNPMTSACLYVINTEYKLDLWKENIISVDAEDVIVELNYVEPFHYTERNKITVDRNFLTNTFGLYYHIGEVTPPKSSNLRKILPCGSMTLMELLRFIEAETGNVFVWWYVKKKGTNLIERFLDFIPQTHRGLTRNAVLDVGYNTENMEYIVDESDTYRAIAPIFSLSDSKSNSSTSTNSTTREDMEKIIENWVNLEVKKGENIPMIAEKKQTTDPTTNTSVEEIIYTAYWNAPFYKNKGEFFVYDELDTESKYNIIKPRPDSYNRQEVPKIGTIKTNETDVYAIYDRCAVKLIEKRYPLVELEVEVSDLANEIRGENPFNVYDKVYMKVRGYNTLILGRVTKTMKNLHIPTKNKVVINNIDLSSRIDKKETYFEINDTVVQENSGEAFTGRLMKINVSELGEVTEEPLSNETISITIVKEQETSTTTTSTEQNNSADTYNQYGISGDGKKIMAIGRPSAVGESKYGYKFYKSIFERKCAFCGSNELYWGIFWAGNEVNNWGVFPATGRREGGSAEGHIFCKSCDADYSCIDGKDHMSPPRRTLTKIGATVSSTKKEAYDLKNGKMAEKTSSTPSASSESVENIMREASNIRYVTPSCSPSCENVQEGYDCVKSKRVADCFGMSAYLYKRLNDAGHKARIVVYYSPYASSGTHRTVQVYQNGKWVDPSYAGFDKRFKAMSSKKNMNVCKDAPEISGSTEIQTTSTTIPGFKKTYTRTTGKNGEFNLNINLEKSLKDYKLICTYGGDIEYARCSQTVNLRII